MYPIAYLKQRLQFWSPRQVPYQFKSSQSHVIVYLGPNVVKFVEIFGEIAIIPGYNSWSFNN